MCSHIHVDWISNVQKSLSNNGEKDIGKYHAALASVFETLTEAEIKQCEDLTVEWNLKDLPDDLQHK